MHQIEISLCDHLTSETVKGLSLTLECVYDIHGSNSLTPRVFRVCDRITDDILQEHLEDTTRLLVNETGDTLDTTTASETPDCRLRDALDVIAKYFTVALGAALAESF